MKMLSKLYRLISPKAYAEGYIEASREHALDVISKHGIEAHYYLAAIGNRSDKQLSEALDILSSAGYIMTDAAGQLVGKVAKARLNSNEKAQHYRASFKVVK